MMEKPSSRIALILLVGAAAIALVLILRHDNSNQRKHAGDSAVLAADAMGAVTQTDDGTTRGYSRAGKLLWVQPPVAGTNGGPPPISNFFCAGACPDAFGNRAAQGKNTILRYGFSVSGAGTPLGPPLDTGDVVLRGVIDQSTLLIRRPAGGSRFEYLFVTPPNNATGMEELSKPVALGAKTLVVALISEDARHVMVAETNVSGSSTASTVRWFQRNGRDFTETGTPYKAADATSCMSSDGRRAAVTGRTAVTMAFGGGNRKTLPVNGSRMTCTFSPDGVTVSTAAGSSLTLTHFDDSGRQKWTRTFGGAAAFNARDFDTTMYQVVTKTGTLLLDQSTGETVHQLKGETAGYPATANEFVHGDGAGVPSWTK